MTDRNIAPIGVDILTPDFKGIAIACGWDVNEIATLENFASLLNEVKEPKKPQLIIVTDTMMIDAELHIHD